MEESYIRGVNQEIIRYLKNIKGTIDTLAKEESVDEVENKVDNIITNINTIGTKLDIVNTALTDIKNVLQEISGKMTVTETT